MDNGLIVDLIFALVLVLGVVLGAKRGLFRSFMALAAVLVALIGASLLTDALTGPVTEALMPRAEKSVQEWFDAAGRSSQGEASALEGAVEQDEPSSESADMASPAQGDADDVSPLAVTGILKNLLHFDLDGAVRRSLRSAAQEAALTAVRTLLGSVVRTVVFLLCFLVLSLLLRLVIAVVDKALGLPVLNTLNTAGGALFGLVESALLLFLVCDLAPKLGFKIFTAYEGTYLLSFFMNQTPRGILSALLP